MDGASKGIGCGDERPHMGCAGRSTLQGRLLGATRSALQQDCLLQPASTNQPHSQRPRSAPKRNAAPQWHEKISSRWLWNKRRALLRFSA